MRIDQYQMCRTLDSRMRDPQTADNIEVRKEILSRIKSGKITLQEGQTELAEIQRIARKSGRQLAYDYYH